jgi:hypothetical protein
MAEAEPSAEGSHEAFHMPPPSIWPPLLALGIALILTGLIINKILLVVGALLALASFGLWVRDARREFRELPE